MAPQILIPERLPRHDRTMERPEWTYTGTGLEFTSSADRGALVPRDADAFRGVQKPQARACAPRAITGAYARGATSATGCRRATTRLPTTAVVVPRRRGH